MKVILLKDIKGVGRRYEEKDVSDGYANNSLIPKGFAVPLNSPSAARVRAEKASGEQAKSKQADAINEAISKIAGTKVEINAKADEKGHLFEKITAAKIAKHLGLESGFINLEEPIKQTGTYEVPLGVGDKVTHFTLEVVRA